MIKIFTYELKDKKTIKDNDSYFFQNVSPKVLGDEAKSAMKKVDDAELIDANTGKIETPRGIGSIEDLSTGCKTIINYLYALENDESIEAINVSYCGYNALDELFDIAEKKQGNIVFVLLHKDQIYKCKERKYLIDNKREVDNLLYL